MKQGIGYGADGADRFQSEWSGEQRPGFLSAGKNGLVAANLHRLLAAIRFSGLFKKIFGDNDKTVIRAGFSRVYDRAGFALMNSFDQIGSAGLSTTLQNTCCTFGVTSAENLPRITGINAIPATNLDGVQFLQPPPPAGFPQITTINSQANLWGTDNTLKTPHAYTADFSIGRELPNGSRCRFPM